MAKLIAINVGVNKNRKWGGLRAPIFPNGTFEFIHIPWKEKYGKIRPRPPKYSEMPYCKYIPEKLLDSQVLISPDFENCTYASTTYAPVNKYLKDLKEKEDFLFFYSTLKYSDNGTEKVEWVNPNWGAYLIGYFKIEKNYESLKYVLSNEKRISLFKDYAWFKSLKNRKIPDDSAPWIKGIVGESCLLKKAIPLSDVNNSQAWSMIAYSFLRTSTGKKLDPKKKAIFQTILTSEGENLDKILDLCECVK